MLTGRREKREEEERKGDLWAVGKGKIWVRNQEETGRDQSNAVWLMPVLNLQRQIGLRVPEVSVI